jgi:hypothetical protein
MNSVKRGVAVVVLLAVVVPDAAASARGSASDYASTRSFLAAGVQFFQAALVDLRRPPVAADRFVGHVAATCPGSLKALQRSQSLKTLSAALALWKETSLDLILTVDVPFDRALRQRAVRLTQLHWSEPSINRAVREGARATVIDTALKPSDLCADIEAAAAARFEMVSPQTTSFDRGWRDASVTGNPLLAKPLDAFVTPGDAADKQQLERLGKRFIRTYSRRVGALFARLTQVLDAPQALS